jgi:predicted O-linked N-acetylglucosamine transferase (SPINDLY family)
MPEWVATDDDDYVRIAVKMAADRQALLALKRDLRTHLQGCAGWKREDYTAAFGDQLRLMWRETWRPLKP